MNEIEEIKARLNLVDLIGQYVTLKKAGANYKGICPFHGEKTPSLMVSPEKQIWKCFGCFPPGQLVKTPVGYHPIETLSDDHPVVSDTGTYRNIITVHNRNFQGNLVTVTTRKIRRPVVATSDHHFLAIRPQAKHEQLKHKYFAKRMRAYNRYLEFSPEYYYRKTEKWMPIQKILASELRPGDLLLYPINRTVTVVKKIDLEQYVFRYPIHGKRPSRLPELSVDNDLLRLLGYWIAEGSNHRAYIRFSLGSHEEEFAQDICQLVKKLFSIEAKLHYRPATHSGIEVTICHAGLAQAFENLCGKGAENKHIPYIFQELPTEKQQFILKAIHRGDGHSFTANRSNKTHKSITTISPVLAEQLTDILVRLGLFPSMRIQAAKTDRKKVNHRESYSIFWSDEAAPRYDTVYQTRNGQKYWLLPIETIRTESYSGPVYNLTVEEDHSYIVSHVAVANCGLGGDHYKFIMETEHLEFGDALRLLAQKAGVTLQSKTQSEHQSQGRKERLYRINAFASRIYHQLLLEHADGRQALEYLTKRGVKKETIEQFRIGYAPRSNPLASLAIKRGILPADLQTAGHPEKFFERIIFPIFDVLGNVIAFTGRALGDVQPKYLNSPETPLFSKGRVLYGLNLAKAAIKAKDQVILVEGQMDVVALHQAGIAQTVASSGTALTEQQLQTLGRYTNNFVLAFDGDAAGIQTTKKVIELLLKLDLNGKVISFAPHKDAAEFLTAAPNGWSEIAKTAQESLDWLISQEVAQVPDIQFIEHKKKVLKALLPTMALLQDPARLDFYVQRLALQLGLKQETISAAVAKAHSSIRPNPSSAEAEKPRLTNEEQLLIMLITEFSLLKKHQKAFESVVWQSSEAHQIAQVVKLCYTDQALPKNSVQFLNSVKTHLDSPLADKIDRWQFWLSTQWPQFNAELAEELVGEKLSQVSTLEHERHKDTLAAEIKKAQEKGDITKIKELLGQLNKLAQQPTKIKKP